MEVAFAWWEFKTDIGLQYRPMCTVDIQKKNGEWEQYVFKIDSGADTMLMEEGDRDSLGYALGDCITCKYTNANNDEIIARYPQFLYKNRRLYHQ